MSTTMNTYGQKATAKIWKDPFDQVLDSTPSPVMLAAAKEESKKVSPKDSSVDRSSKMHLETYHKLPKNNKKDLQAHQSVARPKRDKCKKTKQPKTEIKEKKPHEHPEGVPNFDSFDKENFFVEDERQPLASIGNASPNIHGSGDACKNLSPHVAHKKKQNQQSDLICIDSDTKTLSVSLVKEKINCPSPGTKAFRNITSRGRRLRSKRSISKYDLENIEHPVKELNEWSCSTPKATNHNLGNADNPFELHYSGIGTTPECHLSSEDEQGEKYDGSSSLDLSKVSLSRQHDSRRSFRDSLSACNIKEAQRKVLELCNQSEPIAFADCIPERMMSECIKIGEGVYGEVFKSVSNGKPVALKIIPIEGDVHVNDCPQKRFDEILPEIVIARELSDLALGNFCRSSNFCQVNRISCVKGDFPLLRQWDEYAERKKSENDRPDFFEESQLFIVFEFAHGGCALESFQFQSQREVNSVLRQVVFALAVAERELEFEHRDLHIGNVLVKKCAEERVMFLLDGTIYDFPTEGVIATIIDFTISRLKKDECAVFCDISTDEGLFEGTGDIQFDVYRDMRTKNRNNWEKYHPETNILWTSYLCTKLLTTNRVKNYKRAERNWLQHLRKLDQEIPKYDSCADLASASDLW